MHNNYPELAHRLLFKNDLLEAESIDLHNAIKPIFFKDKGFMHWARTDQREQLRARLQAKEAELLQQGAITPEEVLTQYFEYASEANQGAQTQLFYSLIEDYFPRFEGERLTAEARDILGVIKAALKDSDRTRTRAIMLISFMAEKSNSQSRKSTAGSAAEQAIEVLLKYIGLTKGDTYGRQFKSGQGSDTDFIVPFVSRADAHHIRAYIAVQASTNDRARQSASELHRGAKRFLCSFNGCLASSKNTTDIGDELIAGHTMSESYYVIIESERQAAIQNARERLTRAVGTDRETTVAKRLRWLEEYSINYDQFADQLLGLI